MIYEMFLFHFSLANGKTLVNTRTFEVSIPGFISVTYLQEVLQLAQEFFPLGGVGELEDEVVVLDDADEDHGLLLGVLRDLDGQVLHPLHVNAPQLLPLN